MMGTFFYHHSNQSIPIPSRDTKVWEPRLQTWEAAVQPSILGMFRLTMKPPEMMSPLLRLFNQGWTFCGKLLNFRGLNFYMNWSCLCLFLLVIVFYGLYHGLSPFGEYSQFFPKHPTSKSKFGAKLPHPLLAIWIGEQCLGSRAHWISSGVLCWKTEVKHPFVVGRGD